MRAAVSCGIRKVRTFAKERPAQVLRLGLRPAFPARRPGTPLTGPAKSPSPHAPPDRFQNEPAVTGMRGGWFVLNAAWGGGVSCDCFIRELRRWRGTRLKAAAPPHGRPAARRFGDVWADLGQAMWVVPLSARAQVLGRLSPAMRWRGTCGVRKACPHCACLLALLRVRNPRFFSTNKLNDFLAVAGNRHYGAKCLVDSLNGDKNRNHSGANISI